MTAISTATHVRKNEGTPLWVMGSLFEVKASGAETGGALTVVEMTFAPGQPAAPPHRHDCDEMTYVLKGKVRYHIGSQVVDAEEGDFLFFPKGTVEWVENVSGTPSKALTIYTGSRMADFFAEAGDPASSRTLPPPSAEPPDIDRLMSAAERHGLEVVQ